MTGFSAAPIIIPNAGIELILLKSSIENVLILLGNPTETILLEEEMLATKHQVLRYDDLAMDFYFDVNSNLSLSAIDCANTKALLHNCAIFNYNEKSIIALLKEIGHKLTDTEQHQWGEKRLEFDTAGLEFYFERGKLTLVHIE